MNTEVESQTSTETESSETTTDTDQTQTSTTEGETLLTKGQSAESAEDFTPLTVEDITVPEGMELDEETSSKFIDLVNEAHLPSEVANKLVGLQGEIMERASEQISQLYEDMQTQWQDEARSDPVIGGEKLDQNLASIKQMITEVAGDDSKAVFEALDLTGAGNHPAMIRLFARMAKQFAEGSPTTGAAPAQDAAQTLAERMFPNQGKR